MDYISTRSINCPKISSAEAIKTGLSPDGGLYMPEHIPTLTNEELASLYDMSYPERAAKILAKFLTDYTEEELLADTAAAYAPERFSAAPAPVTALSDLFILELFHGPTCAFKDMALQLMPRLFSRALIKCKEEKTALILTATSGDTGKAALEGYRDIPGVRLQVFYPTDGVSTLQKLQMQTQEGKNLSVIAIRGNFDDAQNGVKAIFSDPAMKAELDKRGVFLSSANSINFGRLAPQIVYYISAYCDLVKNGSIAEGEVIDVAVPTGNFGNIFAAFLAKKMGLPIGTLLCASNRNHVLTDFLESGVYDRNRPFFQTISPSMDILISSNLERLLYLIAGPERTAAYMKNLAEHGAYRLTPEDFAEVRRHFVGMYTDEEETERTVRETYEKQNYLTDPHTAVALCAARRYEKIRKAERKMLVVSTASPYKFAKTVTHALTGNTPPDGIEAADRLHTLTGREIPAPLDALRRATIRFSEVIEAPDMPKTVLHFAENQ
ncbi:MAG TPA: threonine synthase [Clostridiales bacterium]|nr:threonine synthase [Clostridiales bacterium]